MTVVTSGGRALEYVVLTNGHRYRYYHSSGPHAVLVLIINLNSVLSYVRSLFLFRSVSFLTGLLSTSEVSEDGQPANSFGRVGARGASAPTEVET